MEYCFAIVANDKIMELIREIFFEVLKLTKLSGRLQKVYLEASNKKEIGVYIFSVSKVSPPPEISSGSVDYIAFLDPVDDDSQEVISKLLRERGVIVFKKGSLDMTFFVDKMPSVVNVDEDRGVHDLIAILLKDITKLFAIKRELMYKILKTIIKDEDMDLIEAYRMVSKQ